MSIEAITFAKLLDLGDAPPALHLLLARIAEHQYNDTRVCRASQTQLALECGRASDRSVRRWLDELEARRVIIRRGRRSAGGHALEDEIRIVGFTRWYRSQRGLKSSRRAPPAKLSGGSGSGENSGPATGQIVRPPPDSRSPPATGQQESGAYRSSSDLSSDSKYPPNPPKAGGTGGNDLIEGNSKAAPLLAALRADAIETAATDHLLAPVLAQRRVSGLGDDPVATLRDLRRQARHLGTDALKRACQDVLDASPVKVRVAAIAEAIAVAKTAGARIVIVRGSPEWAAWMRHWETTDRPKWQLHARLDRTQVPTRFPAAKPGLVHPEQPDTEQEANHA